MTPATQSNFPALVYTASDAQLGASACTNGEDILFTDSDGTTQLHHEIEEFNEVSGELTAWVEIPTLSGSLPTVIYMYYGDSRCIDQQDIPGTWDEGGSDNFKAVWHMDEDQANKGNAGLYKDATDTNYHHGNDEISATAQNSYINGGITHGGQDFNGMDDYVEIADHNELDLTSGVLTISAWVYARSFGELVNGRIIDHGGGSDGSGGWSLLFFDDYGNKTYAFYTRNGTTFNSPIPVSDNNSALLNQWEYVVVTMSGGTVSFYVDGQPKGTVTSVQNPTDRAGVVRIGRRSTDNFREFDGFIDEVRVSSGIARSLNWIQTEYNNQWAPATYLTFESETAFGQYYWHRDNGTDLGGITTNWSESCGTQITNIYKKTTMTTTPFACSDVEFVNDQNAPVDEILLIKDTSYSQNTDVTGVNTYWYLKDKSSSAKTFRFYLGYVQSGSFTSWGFVDQNVPSDGETLYTIDMSSVSGSAPNGSYLALKVAKQSNNGEASIFLGSTNNSGRLQVNETASSATTTIGDGTSPPSKNVNPTDTYNAVNSFMLSTNSGSDTLTALTVTRSGTGTDSDVAANSVKLWRDDGSSPNEWDAGDTQIGSGASFSSGTASFSSLSETINTTPTQYIITYDIAAGATTGKTLLGDVSGATVSNTLVNNDTTDATLTIAGPCDVDLNGTYIEAENYTAILNSIPNGLTTTSRGGELNGSSSLLTNTGGAGNCDLVTSGPREGRQYTVDFPSTGTYNIWMRGYTNGGGGDNSIFVGFNNSCIVGLAETGPAGWQWTNAMQANSGPGSVNPPLAQFTVGSAGSHTIEIWAREVGHYLDGIYIDRNDINNTPTDGSHGTDLDPSTCANITTIGDGVAPVSRDVWAGGRFFGVDAFTLQTDSGTDNLTALTVTFSGTDVGDVVDGEVKLWKDSGGAINKWDSTDPLISTAALFVGNTATFSGFTEPINTSSTQYIITYNIESDATAGNILRGSVTGASVSNFLVNNDTLNTTLTVEADSVHETSVYKVGYSQSGLEDVFHKESSSPTTDLLQSMSLGSNFSSTEGSLIIGWDPEVTFTTLIDNSVVKRVQMSGLLMTTAGNSHGTVTTNGTFYEDRMIFNMTVQLTSNPGGVNTMFMTYGGWDKAILDDTLWWSSNNSGSYNSVNPPPNSTGSQTAPISFQWLLELGATDGLLNGTMQNISNYGTAALKHNDSGANADAAYQKNPVIGTTYQTAVMYSFDTTTSGYDTTVTEERQDGFISPATLNFVIGGGDGVLDGDGYAELRGAYTLNDDDADDHVRFQFEPTTTHHAPVFEITGWNSGAPGYIDVGGVLKTSGTHYNAAVTGTTLYLQYLSNISANTIIEIPSSCSGFVVTTTADTGMGSLRACIDLANSNPGADTITFNIPGGSCPGGICTINPSPGLPALNDVTGGTTIDGYTQIGAQANTVAAPGASDAVLAIEIDGSGAGAADGITMTSADNTIKGLIIHSFDQSWQAAVLITGAGVTGNTVSGCYLGTNAAGTAADANFNSVYINSGAQSNTIGGTTPADRNVIAGGSNGNVMIFNANTNLNNVWGNYIGTDVSGTSALGGTYGLVISGGAQSNYIGGNTASKRNIISGHTTWQLVIADPNSDSNEVKGNYIGTDVNGTAAIANTADGVAVIDGAKLNLIGGTNTGEGNVIAFNDKNGIQMSTAGTDNNKIYINVIRDNDLHGIEIDAGNNTTIYHNTIHNNGVQAGADNGDGINAATGVTGTIIKNNILSNNDGYGVWDEDGFVSTVADYSDLYSNVTGICGKTDRVTSHDCITGSKNITSDPLYNNEPGDDYTLTECTSPAINMACNLGAAGDDTFCDSAADGAQPDMNGGTAGNFNNNAPDMGAYETSNCVPGLTIVKQVWEVGGTAPLGNPTAPVGATLVFLIYVKNTTAGTVSDLRINDALDEAGFEYVAGSLIRTDAGAPPSDTATDRQIFDATASGTGTDLFDPVDADVASAQDTGDPGSDVDRITIGAVAGQANASLSVGAHETFALRFKVKVK